MDQAFEVLQAGIRDRALRPASELAQPLEVFHTRVRDLRVAEVQRLQSAQSLKCSRVASVTATVDGNADKIGEAVVPKQSS